jgi:hypothetical protein
VRTTAPINFLYRASTRSHCPRLVTDAGNFVVDERFTAVLMADAVLANNRRRNRALGRA